MRSNRLYGRLAVSLILLSTLTSYVYADTVVSGIINTNTTWPLANSPYIVTGNVLVSEGVTLTIEPGIEVRFDSGTALQTDGTLIARGTSTDNITFTSNQSTPAAGDWEFIHLTETSKDATYDADETPNRIVTFPYNLSCCSVKRIWVMYCAFLDKTIKG